MPHPENEPLALRIVDGVVEHPLGQAAVVFSFGHILARRGKMPNNHHTYCALYNLTCAVFVTNTFLQTLRKWLK